MYLKLALSAVSLAVALVNWWAGRGKSNDGDRTLQVFYANALAALDGVRLAEDTRRRMRSDPDFAERVRSRFTLSDDTDPGA